MRCTKTLTSLLIGLALLGAIVGCSSGPPTESSEEATSTPDEAVYAPKIVPADFATGVNNPFWPLAPGAKWIYEGKTEDGLEHIEITVLDEPRVVMGVTCVTVRDTVKVDGVMVEDTLDWYAQDKDGNVWYFGEEVKNYEDSKLVDTVGSWEGGVDGALPGVTMWADPQPGAPYRQEYYAGEAEDWAKVVAVDATANVAFGSYTEVVITEEWTPLEPDLRERKYYAKGIGLVLEDALSPAKAKIELVSYEPPK